MIGGSDEGLAPLYQCGELLKGFPASGLLVGLTKAFTEGLAALLFPLPKCSLLSVPLFHGGWILRALPTNPLPAPEILTLSYDIGLEQPIIC